jgi:hypothetical protein
LGGTFAGKIMDNTSGGGLANLLGGVLGGQAVQGAQDASGIPGGSALLGLLGPMLLGQGQGQGAQQPPMMGAQNSAMQQMAGGMPQVAPQGDQMGMQGVPDATQGQEQTMTPLERQSRMRRYQSAMRAAEAAKSGDIMSLVQTLIMESD